jgi:hypothetical protein
MNASNDQEGKDEYYCIWCFKKPKDDEYKQKTSWLDSIIISENNNLYRAFNFLVSTMCLLSSYYYGAHICFRYSPNVDPHDESLVLLNIFIESIFLMHLFLQFFLEYKPLGEKIPVRNLSKIGSNYLNSKFALDFITIIPLQYLELKRNRQYCFYIIKMIRIIRGFHLFDIGNMMGFVKSYYQNRIIKLIEAKPALGNNVDADNNCIELQLFISYTLKTLRLAIIILNIAYLTGVFWLFMVEFVNDFILDIDLENHEDYLADENNPETFIGYYGMTNNT